jgi:MoaD family protein
MVTINVAGFLADFTNGRSEIPLNSSPVTVGEALNELWQLHVGLRDRVVNEQGQLRTHVNIFVNGENIRRQQLLDTPLSDRTEITILPSVSGGDWQVVKRKV